MKNLFLILFLVPALIAGAQTKTTAAKKPVPAKTAKPAAPALKNLSDSASYAIGLSVANFYAQQGMKNLNASLVSKAISDVLAQRKTLIDEMAVNDVIMAYMNQAQQAKAQPNIQKGEQFLATNKAKAGVKTTATGLQYEVVREGTGPKPAPTDTVVVHYAGTLLDGTEFDNSYKRGEPATFPVNRVIPGWTEALQLMPVGSKFKLYIPHELAYGTNETGPIPAGSVLVYEVELLSINGKQ